MKIKLMSLIFMAACTTAIAHDSIDFEPQAVTAADADYTFDLHFTTLFLKPTCNTDFAVELNLEPISSPDWQTYRVLPNYSFAFDLGVNLVLHKNNNIIMTTWEHFLSADSASQNVGKSTNVMRPMHATSPITNTFQNAAATINYSRDTFRADFGQLLEINDSLHMNLFTGVNFSRITQVIDFAFATNALQTYQVQALNENTFAFSGVGPELGLNIEFQIHKGLYVVNKSIVACLTGTIQNHVTYENYSAANDPNPNIQDLIVANDLQMVPVISQNIGIGYELFFRGHGMMNVEVGYQAQIYINVLNFTSIGTTLVSPPITFPQTGVFPESFFRRFDSLGLGGPYFKLEIAF